MNKSYNTKQVVNKYVMAKAEEGRAKVDSNKDEKLKPIPVEDKSDENNVSGKNGKIDEKSNWDKNIALKGNEKGLPILMYHSIAYEKGNNLRVPVQVFKEQMQVLKDEGFATLTLEQAYDFLKNNKPIPEKSVVITFDDGYLDNYTDAFPVLKSMGFKATVFVITSQVDKNPTCITSEMIKDMDKNGFDIQSHTVHHLDLDGLTYEKQVQELKQSKEFLDKLLNKDVRYIAYPTGRYNENTLKAMKEAGYNMGVLTLSGWSYKEDGSYTLSRVRVLDSDGAPQFRSKLLNEVRGKDAKRDKIKVAFEK